MTINSFGLFDSGVGGLTVLNVLRRTLPPVDFIYLGDTARLPYGTKSSLTVKKYVEQIINFLLKKNVSAIVSACHSASSAILQHQITASVPIYNVISPACKTALSVSKNKKIGVLATQATVSSGIYPQFIKGQDSSTEVFQMAAPLLVPLVEAGWIEDPITNLIVMRYCGELKAQGVDTLIMACTHYPVLRKTIQRCLGNDISLIDPAESLSMELSKINIKNNKTQTEIKFYFTESSQNILTNTKNILDLDHEPQVEHVDLLV